MKSLILIGLGLLLSGGSTFAMSTTFDVCGQTEKLACRKMLNSDWPEEVHLEIDILHLESKQSVGLLFKMGNHPNRVETACLGGPLNITNEGDLVKLSGDIHCLDGTGGLNEFVLDRKAMTLADEGGDPYTCQCEKF